MRISGRRPLRCAGRGRKTSETATRMVACFVAACLGALAATPVAADEAADFYRGKTITCYIGYSVGGGYDLIARIISRHMASVIRASAAVQYALSAPNDIVIKALTLPR